MVVPQLAERSITIQEVRSSNPVAGKTDTEHFLLVNVEKTKRKKKEAGNGPFLWSYNVLASSLQVQFPI